MGLVEYILGAVAVWDSRNSPKIPGEPYLTAEIRLKGHNLEVTIGEQEMTDDFKSTRYDISIDGNPAGTYRVRENGEILSEILYGKPTEVIRNIFLDSNKLSFDESGLTHQNFQGTKLEDLRRWFYQLEAMGTYPFFLSEHPKLQDYAIRRKMS